MFVPCEPEIVTEEWGWGEDLDTLHKEKNANAMRDARTSQGQSITNPITQTSWDGKAMRHKTVLEITMTQTAIDIEAHELGQRFARATQQRERARQVLYSYAWKALMLAIVECKQLTVEKKI
jgi:hypothetical protein